MVYGGELVAQNNNVELSSLPFKPPLGGMRITRPRWVRSFLSFRLARLNCALSAAGSRAPGSEVPRPWETSRSWAEPWRRRSPPARQERAIRTPAGAEKPLAAVASRQIQVHFAFG